MFHVQAYIQKPGPFCFYHDLDINPIITAHYPNSSKLRWRIPMREFTGDEIQDGILPQWVVDAVMRGRIPTQPPNKVSFTIEPFGPVAHLTPVNSHGVGDPIGPPNKFLPRSSAQAAASAADLSERLTAPTILEIRKVANYVANKLRDLGNDVSAPEVTFDLRESAANAVDEPAPHVGIAFGGRLLPSALTLNTVKRFLCKGRVHDDIALQYLIIDWGNPPPIADIVPKVIEVDS
jgi:hypothetical protein